MNLKHILSTHVRIALTAGVLLIALSGCSRQATDGADVVAGANLAASTPPAPVASAADLVVSRPAEKPLPRLVDIGARTCIPCRLMKPILDDLMATRAHQFKTQFVDLGIDRELAMSFRIRVIPTQVFYDENGRELGRHEGFMSKEDILKTWKQLGYEFDPTG